jgi:hypothetical protein
MAIVLTNKKNLSRGAPLEESFKNMEELKERYFRSIDCIPINWCDFANPFSTHFPPSSLFQFENSHDIKKYTRKRVQADSYLRSLALIAKCMDLNFYRLPSAMLDVGIKPKNKVFFGAEGYRLFAFYLSNHEHTIDCVGLYEVKTEKLVVVGSSTNTGFIVCDDFFWQGKNGDSPSFCREIKKANVERGAAKTLSSDSTGSLQILYEQFVSFCNNQETPSTL